MSAPSLQSYRVWDAPTRWFHWINFACVVGLAAIGIAILYEEELGVTNGGKILLKTTHVWIGYVFAANLSWRIVWAFVGNRYARWSAIVPFHRGSPAATKYPIASAIPGKPGTGSGRPSLLMRWLGAAYDTRHRRLIDPHGSFLCFGRELGLR